MRRVVNVSGIAAVLALASCAILGIVALLRAGQRESLAGVGALPVEGEEPRNPEAELVALVSFRGGKWSFRINPPTIRSDEREFQECLECIERMHSVRGAHPVSPPTPVAERIRPRAQEALG